MDARTLLQSSPQNPKVCLMCPLEDTCFIAKTWLCYQHLATNPKHSTIQAAIKRINSIPARPSMQSHKRSYCCPPPALLSMMQSSFNYAHFQANYLLSISVLFRSLRVSSLLNKFRGIETKQNEPNRVIKTIPNCKFL